MKKIVPEIQLYETDRQFPFRLFCNRIISTQNHWHTEIEIIYVLTNSLDAHINGIPYHLNQGDILFIPGGDIHGIDSSDHTRLVIQFELDIIDRKYTRTGDLREIRAKLCTLERISPKWPAKVREQVAALIHALQDAEKIKTEIGYRLRIQSLICQLIDIFWNQVPESADQLERQQFLQNKKILQNLEKVFRYINDYYSNQISLEDVAEILGYSPNHFSKLFKKYLGTSFHTYLNEYRIHQAIRLLIESNFSISDIGYRVGFQSLKSFNRVFKSIAGTSPSGYRRSAAPGSVNTPGFIESE